MDIPWIQETLGTQESHRLESLFDIPCSYFTIGREVTNKLQYLGNIEDNVVINYHLKFERKFERRQNKTKNTQHRKLKR